MIFVLVNNIPSIGQWVTVGNGVVGQQPVAAVTDLPASSGFSVAANTTSNASSRGAAVVKAATSAATTLLEQTTAATTMLALAAAALFLVL